MLQSGLGSVLWGGMEGKTAIATSVAGEIGTDEGDCERRTIRARRRGLASQDHDLFKIHRVEIFWVWALRQSPDRRCSLSRLLLPRVEKSSS